jgi:uncharacterized membrane-anchored protein YhcB (DUF1043 family)
MVNSILIFVVGVVVGLLASYLVKNNKKKRTSALENLMLTNHSEILKLQKKVSDLEEEKKRFLQSMQNKSSKTLEAM